jgi:hypothetical protein
MVMMRVGEVVLVLDGIRLLLLLPTVEILRGVSFPFLPEHIVVKL